jgi:hypothetical protein
LLSENFAALQQNRPLMSEMGHFQPETLRAETHFVAR